MVITVVSMRVVEVTIDQVVYVITMGDRFVTTARTMYMS